MSPLRDDFDGFSLEVPRYWYDLAPDVRAEAYNGVGPGWFPPTVRALLDRHHFLLLPSRAHDVEYTYGLDEFDRKAADARFLRNAFAVVWQAHGHQLPRLIFHVARELIAAWLAYRALRRFGRLSFYWHRKRPPQPPRKGTGNVATNTR